MTLSRDSAPQQATRVGRTTLYTVTLAQNEGGQTPGRTFKLTGRVDSVALSTSNIVPRQSTGTNAPPHFTAELSATGHLTNLTSDAITSCRSGTDPLTAALQAVIVPLPQAVSIGSSWRDTISIATCRGRAPIITTVRRHYKVIADTTWQAQAALRIYRTDSLTVRSQSDTGAAAMIVHGAGNATATLYVAASTGLLINARSQGSTRLTVVTGQSSFPFRQDATETITLIP